MAEKTIRKRLSELTGETDAARLTNYVWLASETIKAHTGVSDLTGLDAFVLRLAVYMINKEGAEFQSAHSENGISRTWSASDIPAEYWAELEKAVANIKPDDYGAGWI